MRGGDSFKVQLISAYDQTATKGSNNLLNAGGFMGTLKIV